MTRRTSARTAIALLAGVIIGGLTTGVTYAATSSASAGVKACANRAGDLALLSKDKCPRGYKATTISKKGATGKAGPRGKTGSTGRAGTNGVGATSATLDLTYTGNPVSTATTRTVGTFGGYHVTITCYPDDDILSFTRTSGSQDLYIRGALGSSGEADDEGHALPAGYNQITDDLQGRSSWFYDALGKQTIGSVSDFSAQLLLSSGTSTATLDAYLYSYVESSGQPANDSCQANAQLTPSTTQGG